MSVDEIANAFISHFYTTLDSAPANLASLYVSASYSFDVILHTSFKAYRIDECEYVFMTI
jgi:hypothetical protein